MKFILKNYICFGDFKIVLVTYTSKYLNNTVLYGESTAHKCITNNNFICFL